MHECIHQRYHKFYTASASVAGMVAFILFVIFLFLPLAHTFLFIVDVRERWRNGIGLTRVCLVDETNHLTFNYLNIVFSYYLMASQNKCMDTVLLFKQGMFIYQSQFISDAVHVNKKSVYL